VLYPHLSKIKALVHITGGGFVENVPRVLSENLSAMIHFDSWNVPDFWKLIQQKAKISTEEMYRVFNMGIGMIAIVDESQVTSFQSSVSEPTFIIGKLVEGQRKVILN
jgi:phosphoribosylaminoimidazole (AIR) synthetase